MIIYFPLITVLFAVCPLVVVVVVVVVLIVDIIVVIVLLQDETTKNCQKYCSDVWLSTNPKRTRQSSSLTRCSKYRCLAVAGGILI